MIEITSFGSGSGGNAYRVTDGVTPLLLEAGIKYREIQKGFDFRLTEVAGCLLTHEHGDHSKSIKDIMKAGINVYTSPGTIKTLGISGHRLKPVKAMQQFQLGSWTILPFDTEHDVSEPLGFLLANQDGEKLLFATDTYYIRYKFKGLTHIMVECNYSTGILNQNILDGRIPQVMRKRLLQSHFSLENVKEFFKANDLSKVQEIWLLHLSDTNSDAAMFKEEIMKLTGKMVVIP
ncbi:MULTISPECIES: MBL fold metallo-hydrolase [Heyndrickxia]|uniref:MBL fold metallo-hydrolase n=1 Tax=Heyndrickxia TaxID=2837504 RepID=UPI000555F146|nr:MULTISPECIES: MBL fold metallo-hydrolase [Heyndrickxia]KGT40328.1 beta-lactamase [Heyndrickxia coagulans P38]MED4922099.1 MBL fold metallo-hydrolase [Weizmannia sp. CD-2023]MED4936278.1 MBL fold metallo-hydrolase [Heyndrickxia coagulans]NMH83291.1 MBL fold metallo-hydrolase [Heyndrickxia coagulans]